MPEETPVTPEVKPSEKMFTQEEVNGMITKESRKAVEKLLTDLGVESFENAKEGLTKLKEFQDGQKSELEQLQEKLKSYETGETETKTKLEESNNKLAMLEAGIPVDKIARYSKLVNSSEGETLADRIKSTLEEFPVTAPVINAPDVGGQTGGAPADANAEMMAIARAAAESV